MLKFIKKTVYGFEFERKTNLYERIGIRQFKKIVPLGDFWIILYNKLFSSNLRIIKSKEDAIIWVLFTLSVELLHFIAFNIILWFTIRYAINSDYYKVFTSIGINIIVNLYPIIVQRYNRVRILEVFKITLSDLRTIKLE